MKRTGTILLVLAFSLGIYDVWTGFTCGSDTTISWVVYCTSTKYPIIPFGVGVLCGHLFASMHGIANNTTSQSGEKS